MKAKTLRYLIYVILFLFSLLFSSACQRSDSDSTPGDGNEPPALTFEEYMTNFIETEMAKQRVMGLAIVIVDGQDTLWIAGFGYADKENSISVTPDTLFKVGSVSKLFTAIAVMQLKEAGLIGLDQPIWKYIPEFAIKSRYANPGDITPRNIMTHHSGIPGDKVKGFLSLEPGEDFRTITAYLQDEQVSYPTNYIWAYSNIGIDMLGVLVERVSGTVFADYVRENILTPTAMPNSNFGLTESMQTLFSLPYSAGDDEAKELPYIRDVPAGDFISSADELANFMKMVLAGGTFNGQRVLEEKTLQKMFALQNGDVSLDLGIKMGLAWFLNRSSLEYTGKYAGHGGDTVYYHAMVQILPDHELGAAVLTNTDSGGSVAGNIADEALKKALEMKTGISPPTGATHKVPDLVHAAREEWPGYYATSVGLVHITEEGDDLKIVLQGQQFTLVFQDDGWCTLRSNGSTVDDVRLAVLRIDGEKIVAVEQAGLRVAIGKTYEKAEIPKTWQQRTGKYRVKNADFEKEPWLNEDWYITHTDGILYFRPGISSTGIVLLPVDDDEAVRLGLGRGMNDTVYVMQGNKDEELLYSGLRLKKISSETPGLRALSRAEVIAQLRKIKHRW